MSDKTNIDKRLDNLFADLEQDFTRATIQEDQQLLGWTWACNAEGRYTACSAEAEVLLGVEVQAILDQELATFKVARASQKALADILEEKAAQRETTVQFETQSKGLITVRMTMIYVTAEGKNQGMWRGFNQILAAEQIKALADPVQKLSSEQAVSATTAAIPFSSLSGIALDGDQIISVSTPYSLIGYQSMDSRKTMTQVATDQLPSALAVPVALQHDAIGLLEIIDEAKDRQWSEDEQRLVEEVAIQLSLALENARLFQETTARSEEISLINRVVSKVAASLDINESLQIVSTELGEALNVQTSFALFNPQNTAMTVVAEYSPNPDRPSLVNTVLPITNNPSAEKVLATQQAVFIEDAHTNALTAPIHDLLIAHGVYYLAIFPILLQNQIIGSLGIDILDKNRALTKDEIRLVETVLAQISTAIQNTRLFEQVTQRSHELALINRVVSQIASTLDITESFQLVANEVGKSLNVQTGIAILNERATSLTLVADYSPNPNRPSAQGIEIPISGNPSTEKVFKTKEHLIIENPQTDPMTAPIHDLLRKHNVQSMAIFPILVQDEVIGTFGLDILEAQRTFTDDEIRLVDAIITQAATAIQNARLFEQVQARSIQLQTATEVSRAASSILEPNPLIQQTVSLIRERFKLYYAGIFLIDERGLWTGEAERWAVLRAGTGDAGRIQIERGHKLEIKGDSMIGRCITLKEAQISQLAVEEAQRFANPLLPDTQSEMAMPLISRGKVIGAMTIQSTQADAFSAEDVAVLQTMADQVANALQNANLFDQTQARAEELSVLNDMSRALATELDTHAILQNIYLYTSRLIDTSTFFIALYDSQTEMISFPLAIEGNQELAIPERSLGEGLTEYVISARKPVLIHEDVEGWLKKQGIAVQITEKMSQSWLGVPMLIGEISHGIICVQNESTHHFTENHRGLLVAIASQSAIALQNARLFELSTRHAEELAILNEMSQELSRQQDVDQIIEIMYQYTSRLMDTSYFFVSFYDKRDEILTFPLAVENNQRAGISPTKKSAGLTQYVIDSQEPLLIYDHADQAIANLGLGHILVDEPVQSWLGVPLIIGGDVFGVIAAQNAQKPRMFNEHHQELLLSVARQSAIAIQNARLFAQTEEALAEMEALFNITSVANRSLQIQSALDEVLSEVLRITGFDSGVISIYNTESNQLDLAAHQNLPQPLLDHLEKHGFDDSLCALVYTRRDIVTVNDMREDFSLDLSAMAAMGLLSYQGVPLEARGRILGTLCAFSNRVGTPLETGTELMLAVGQQIGVAIENARLFEEQLETTAQLREIDTLKSQFLANMSHELRTPLNSIIGFSRVIMKGIDGPVTSEQEQDLGAIYNAGQHLLNMINDILDISKIEAHKMELSFEEVNLTQIIESVLSTARGLIKDKPVNMITAIADDLPNIQADSTRVRQILLNLLSNASKFTEKGNITVSASKRTSMSGHPEIYISVTDTGMGIALEDQKNLFEPFTQVDGSATRKTGGTGLGLSITRLLVELHGGIIGIDSAENKGTTFYFTLPLKVKESSTILSVDGDSKVIALYQRYLIDSIYQVTPVYDPAQIVELAREQNPFAITLDVALPNHDGWELLRALKTNPDTQDIPVIICSIQEAEEKAYSLGASDYLAKPILRNDLIRALARLQEKFTS